MVLGNGRPLVRTSKFFPRLGLGGFGPRKSENAGQQRRGTATAHQNPTASAGNSWWSAPLVLPAAAFAFGGGLTLALKVKLQSQQEPQLGERLLSSSVGSKSIAWEQTIAQEPGAIKVLDAETLMAQEHPFLEDDHMFAAFAQKGIINDIGGWYLPDAKKFNAIVALGREVAGFPRVVHGGLTAAIFDEAFGGLLYSLKKTGATSFWGPAYTVQLEVSYKHKIPAGATVLCSAEVESLEGRKLWMKAVMSDGPDGKVYATARALFVNPKPQRLVMDVVKYLGQRVAETLPKSNSARAKHVNIDVA